MSYGNDYQETLHPGIKITSNSDPSGGGTLGCFAQLVIDPKKIVILSNAHVLYGDWGSEGTKVGQPKVSCSCCHVVAHNHSSSFRHAFVRVTSPPDPEYAGPWDGAETDCAIALLNDKRPYTNKTLYGMIAGTPASGFGIAANDRVQMVGSVSRQQGGTILEFKTVATYRNGGTIPNFLLPIVPGGNLIDEQWAGVPSGSINQMLILPDPHHDPNLANQQMHFAAKGDSGAVLVNSNLQVVGLLSGIMKVRTPESRAELNKLLKSNLPPHAGTLGIASPIGPVLTELGIQIDPDMHGTVTSAGNTIEELARVQVERKEELAVQERLRQLEQEIRSRRLGAAAIAAIERQRVEVFGLLQTQRRVISTWHRNHGPAYAAHCRHSVRNPEYVVPEAIDGATPVMLLQRMAAVLRRHGSPELIADIDAYEALAYDWIDGCTSIWQLVKRMRRLEPLPIHAPVTEAQP